MNENIISRKEFACQAQRDFRLFLRDCKNYCIDVVDAKNSPWGANAHPVPYFQKKGESQLGKHQRAAIKFLHERYFRWGKPCYLKVANIAKQTGADATNMAHTISSLVKRGILIRIHFMYNDCNRSLLLPSLPIVKRALQKILSKTANHIRGSVVLFQKLPESLRIQSLSIYNNIHIIRHLVTNKIKLPIKKLLRSFRIAARSGVQTAFACLKKGLTMNYPAIQRWTLRRKPDSNLLNPTDQAILTKLKANAYNLNSLSIDERKVLVALFDFRHNIELDKLLPGVKLSYRSVPWAADEDAKGASWNILEELKIFRKAMELLEGGVNLDWAMAEKVITHWNNSIDVHKNQRFQKLRVDPKSKTYIKAVISLTHVLYYKVNSIAKIINAVSILMALDPEIRYKWYSTKKIPFTFAFTFELKNTKKFNALFEARDINEYIAEQSYLENGHIAAFDSKVVPMMINHLYNGDQVKGEKMVRVMRGRLLKWFHTLSNEFLPATSKRVTCGLKLIGKNEKHGIAPLIEEFFHYISTRSFFVPPSEMIRDTWWESFVKDKMRVEFGFTDFWKFDKSKQIR